MREWFEVQEEARLEEHETWLKERERAENENHAELEGQAAKQSHAKKKVEAKVKPPAHGTPCPCGSRHKYKKCCGRDAT